MTELYQVVRYNRVMFEGDEAVCRVWINTVKPDMRYLQIWKKSVREGINRGWV